LWGWAGEGGCRERRAIRTGASKLNQAPSQTFPNKGGGESLIGAPSCFFIRLFQLFDELGLRIEKT
jgi:hypothetical protein